ncbi:MAG: histidinol dehydrogenase [Verrucomicrobia bacterium]|jgi:histidinol dehydrogenase|nr:histidinol dehydrogenase [Verrucomicrobiota bacterium]MDI9379798.1 histidinol dehydrogenase [Verrucomicrobiota bacterium]NMD19882.1 histidinol dehydrogenase [Verrucomicrobiota bacterium]HNU99958.1 histidinol dehydrogenase [Verrucomicrobiota bacterium]HOA61336.1 histidinol dehydrogenase [Verrucomicrobiota bacterium]
MNVLRHTARDFALKIHEMARETSLFDPEIEQRTRAILDAVQKDGDAALLTFTRQFDGADLRADQLAMTQADLLAASVRVDETFRKTIGFAAKNIEQFSRRSLRRGWSGRNAQGAKVGEKYDPFQRVGLYVPGGTAPLVSTVLMTVVLARVAGCPEIVVCTPCGRDGTVKPELLVAARMAGATEIYRVGGAHAVAAMALGTRTIRPVQKVFGPGNAYVVAAKRLLFGRVAIDLLPGPSEVLVLADDSANPRYVAADLLAQAEHGSGHERVWLVTPSARLLRAVQTEVKRQVPGLARREFIERALANSGWLIQVKTLAQGIEVANELAPEHCEIHTRDARKVADRILTAGALFLGPWSPTVLGDYVAGPSHTLPTGGAGRNCAGLTVDQFQRRTSVVEYDRPSLLKSLAAVQAFVAMEGLGAHGRSAEVRLRK